MIRAAQKEEQRRPFKKVSFFEMVVDVHAENRLLRVQPDVGFEGAKRDLEHISASLTKKHVLAIRTHLFLLCQKHRVECSQGGVLDKAKRCVYGTHRTKIEAHTGFRGYVTQVVDERGTLVSASHGHIGGTIISFVERLF